MNKTRVSIIVAIDEKRGIGKNNDLLFKISEDLKRFRELTKKHVIIMGRRTFESIGRILPDRTSIVLSHDSSKTIDGVLFAVSLKEAIQIANDEISNNDVIKDEIFIIGGGQIFKQALGENLVDRIYLTKVHGDYKADTFFPDYEKFGFNKIIEKEDRKSDGYIYSFITLEK